MKLMKGLPPRSVRIEQNSVNSIILKDQPQDPHQRFLVAAKIGINATGSTVVARDTTLMPNIHGLMPLVSLVFAPFAEMRVDRDKRQYTGALVGLGYDPTTNEALLPDYDSELVFEVDFTERDIVDASVHFNCDTLRLLDRLIWYVALLTRCLRARRR